MLEKHTNFKKEPMSPYQLLDIDEWNRRDTYHFFKDYSDPIFSISTQVDVTALYTYCKQKQLSFFLTNLHCSVYIANQIVEFRIRRLDDKLVVYDQIFPGSAVLHDDKSMSFCYFDYYEDLDNFIKFGKEKLKDDEGNKVFDGKKEALDLIHYSVIPWTSFTSIKHARNGTTADTVPKIVFGKIFEQANRRKMPISIEVNHSIMDGYHVGLYLEQFQAALDRFRVE